MKTLTTPFDPLEVHEAVKPGLPFAVIASILRKTLGVLLAVTTMVVLVSLSVWLMGREPGALLAVPAWGAGFVFLGMAIDSRGPGVVFKWIMGLALPALALLQDRVSSEFVVVAGLLLAAWVGHGILKRTFSQL